VLTWADPEDRVGAVAAAWRLELLVVVVVVVVVDVVPDPEEDPVTAAVVPSSVDDPGLLTAATEPRPAVAMAPTIALPMVRERSLAIARSRSAGVRRVADVIRCLLTGTIAEATFRIGYEPIERHPRTAINRYLISTRESAAVSTTFDRLPGQTRASASRLSS
jgi:hypothetical protein